MTYSTLSSAHHFRNHLLSHQVDVVIHLVSLNLSVVLIPLVADVVVHSVSLNLSVVLIPLYILLLCPVISDYIPTMLKRMALAMLVPLLLLLATGILPYGCSSPCKQPVASLHVQRGQ